MVDRCSIDIHYLRYCVTMIQQKWIKEANRNLKLAALKTLPRLASLTHTWTSEMILPKGILCSMADTFINHLTLEAAKRV